MDPGVPNKIGRYEVDRLLGSGAMGYVYLGRDPELDRAVAIKTVRDLGLDSERMKTFLERFRNEARAAARLHDPSIVQVYDVGEDEEAGPYLVFEYVAGSTLKQVLKSRGAMPPEDAVRLAEQVATALDLAHDHGIIHRDLKPDNLLVTPDGDAKLADFGVARVPNAALTREGQFLGTPCYAAPETLAEGEYSVKSDLFSFAAVLYELISGARAFPGDDAVAVAHKVIHDEPPPPSEMSRGSRIPKAVDDVVMRGLSKDAKKRYTDAHALAGALRAAYEKAGLVDPQPPPTGRIRRQRRELPPKQSGPWAFVAVLAGGLAVGIALVVAFDQGPEDIEAEDAGAALLPPADAGGSTDQPDAGSDAGAAVEDAGPDAGEDAGRQAALDAGPDMGIASMASHEREERAKDLVDRARALIEAGDFAGARRALDQARQYDPGYPDIEDVLALIPPEPEPPTEPSP